MTAVALLWLNILMFGAPPTICSGNGVRYATKQVPHYQVLYPCFLQFALNVEQN